MDLSFLKDENAHIMIKHTKDPHRTISYGKMGYKNNILNLHLTEFLFFLKCYLSQVNPQSQSYSPSVRIFYIEIRDCGDVEVFHTNLRDENALGFTEVNGEEQFVQVCNTLDQKEFVTTLLHELVHVVQNEQGIIDEVERESEAYRLEEVLYNNYCASLQGVH